MSNQQLFNADINRLCAGINFQRDLARKKMGLLEAALVVQRRDLDVVETLFQETCLEGLLHVIFAVNDEEGLDFLRVLAGEELKQIINVSVCAHAADAAYFRVDFVKDAEDMYLFDAGHQAATQRMGFAIPYH